MQIAIALFYAFALGMAIADPTATEDASDPGSAQATQGENSPAWAVILWGSTEESRAREWLERYRASGAPVRVGYPVVVDSGMIDGLNPGFWIVLGAQPTDPEVAEQLQDAFRCQGP